MLKIQLGRKRAPTIGGPTTFKTKSFHSTKSVLLDAQAREGIDPKETYFQSTYSPVSFEKLVQRITAQHIIQDRPKKVLSMLENTIVFDALKRMSESDLGCMIVDRYSGGFSIFTETDYVRKIAIKGLSSKTTELSQVANPQVVTVAPNATIEQMSNLMMQDGIHHLPVVEIDGPPNNPVARPIAVISSRDVASHFVQAAKQAIDYELEGTLIQVFENLGRKNAADIWLRDEDSVYNAIKKMTDNRIGALLVNANNVFAGIFTERDYLNKIILKGRSSKQTQLKEVMTPKPQFIPADFPIKDCLNLALEKQFRHIPIVSLLGGNEINSESLVGMVTINDIIAYLMLELEVKRLKRMSPDLR